MFPHRGGWVGGFGSGRWGFGEVRDLNRDFGKDYDILLN